MGTAWGHCGPTGHPLQPQATPSPQTCSATPGTGDGAGSTTWGQQPLAQPGGAEGQLGTTRGGDTGTAGSPEDSGSAPGRLCRHGHAAAAAPLPPCLRPWQRGLSCPGSEGGGSAPAAPAPVPAPGGSARPQGEAVPVVVQPPPRAMCHLPCAMCHLPCARSSRARRWARTPSVPGSRGAVGRGARGFHNPGLAVYLSAGAGPGGGCLFAESAGSRPRGGGKGSRGTRLGRPARRWGGAGMGMALPAPPEPSWSHPLVAGPPPTVLPAHTSTH